MELLTKSGKLEDNSLLPETLLLKGGPGGLGALSHCIVRLCLRPALHVHICFKGLIVIVLYGISLLFLLLVVAIF